MRRLNAAVFAAALLSSGCFNCYLVNLSTSATYDEDSDDAVIVLKRT
jgi:hypothetical protein